jgi:microsomal dipeptidase-like Zn-dependent dipeptidase
MYCMKKVFADIHCHPTLKPYGQSFNELEHSENRKSKANIWQYDPPTIKDKLLQFAGGLTRFRQSNFTALGYGNVGLISASLYPLEQGFMLNKLPNGNFGDLLKNFITGVSKNRIDYVQSKHNYFDDLQNEYKFLLALSNKEYNIDGQRYKYVVAKNKLDIEKYLDESNPETTSVFTIVIVISIEGAHAFGTGINYKVSTANDAAIIKNINSVKNWEHRPLFIGLAHHFYNHICGHSKSLKGIMERTCNQSEGINTGFTDLGLNVVKELLDNKSGKRILIDIKHMSALAKREYFNLLKTKYPTENIPVVVSHGGCIGSEFDRHLFYNEDINFTDDEILIVAKSRGIFGIQLDERRIASHSELQKTRGEIARKKILYNWSRLVWRQIQHIAELLDCNGMFAWELHSIGSDFDGLIDPINGYWTAEELQFLDDYLLKHAYNYMNDQGKNLKLAVNKVNCEEIVNRVMGENAINFMMRNF